jgi:hypothetical protein
VLDDGLTVVVIGLLLPLKLAPLDNVPLHGPVPVTTMLSVAFCPLHIVVVPVIFPVGLAFTVTTALPVLSADIDVQFASDSVLIVQVVLDDGLTEAVIGLLLPLKLAPLDSVPLHGPVPVTAMLSDALCPLHIVVVPVIAPVGLALTVTTALPVLSADIDIQFASDNVLIV